MSQKKLVSFRLQDELMQNLRTCAQENGISVTELVSRLLRQGLQTKLHGQLSTVVDERISSLEAEIQELRRAKYINSPQLSMANTPMYALLTQSTISTETEVETKERLTRLEQMLEKLMDQNGFDINHCSS